MAKTNFTKVEEALAEGMRKMTMEHVHALADSISEINAKGFEKTEAETKNKLIAILKFELNWLGKQDPELHKKLGIKRSEIKKLIDKKEKLTAENFEKIKSIKEKLEQLKKELNEKSPQTNEELIEKERTKHINKRFNKNDNWLPLH
ncbi:MAG TPA: hypothetical protein PLC42_02920 [Parachlamydiaceae bacterium]|nr:hypothetical protein [Parachlamydiaceae bacterium]